MIRFKTINADGNVCEWQYESVEKLESIWRSDDIDMDVPANDDPVFDIEIDGKRKFVPIPIHFEDFLEILGIDIGKNYILPITWLSH